MRDFYFGRAAASDEGAFFDQAADYAEGVVQRALGFVKDEAVGAAANDADGGAGGFVGDAGHFDDAGAEGLVLFDEFGGAELVFGEGVDVGDWFAAGGLGRGLVEVEGEEVGSGGYLADEFDFVTFYVFDGEDFELGEKVKT